VTNSTLISVQDGLDSVFHS